MQTAILVIALTFGAEPTRNVVPQAEIDRLAKRFDLTPDAFVKFAEQCERNREPLLKDVQKRIKLAKKDVFSRPKGSSARKEAEAFLKDLEDSHERIDKRKVIQPPELGELVVGAVGLLPSDYYFKQHLGYGTIRVKLEKMADDVILKGVPTILAVPDVPYSSASCFRVTGSQSYTPELGAKVSLMVLEPFNTSPVSQYLRLVYDEKQKQP